MTWGASGAETRLDLPETNEKPDGFLGAQLVEAESAAFVAWFIAVVTLPQWRNFDSSNAMAVSSARRICRTAPCPKISATIL
jgi:hypothetical protein